MNDLNSYEVLVFLNSKHEIRNPKQIQNPNVPNKKNETSCDDWGYRFGILNISIWELLRISDF
jgi:hypothetical protein